MIKIVIWFWNTFTKGILIKVSKGSFNFLPPKANIFHNRIILNHNFWAADQKGYYTCCWSWMKMEGRGLPIDKNWPAGDSMPINL
jgi:hypothetical protein